MERHATQPANRTGLFIMCKRCWQPAVDPAHVLIYRTRHCEKFFAYQPRLSPSEHLFAERSAQLENDRRRFETTLSEFQAKLASRDARQNKIIGFTALAVTVVIGIIQLWTAAVSMVPESLGYEMFGRPTLELTKAIANWFCRHL